MMDRVARRALHWIIPLIGILLTGAVPLVRYAQKTAAEDKAVDGLQRVHEAQLTFRRSAGGGFAVDLASLITPCGVAPAPLSGELMPDLARNGYRFELRAAERARPVGRDCHGRETMSDYYAAVRPESPTTAAQQAFAITSRGRIYLFYDGVPPAERDMLPGGLAIPHDAAATFKIP